MRVGAEGEDGITGTTPTLAALLRHHRLAAGFTQEGLAEAAGLSARGVQDLEPASAPSLTPRPSGSWPKPWASTPRHGLV